MNICACGKENRYSHGEGESCNKYGRCLTWEQQQNKIYRLLAQNTIMKAALERIAPENTKGIEEGMWAEEALIKCKKMD